VGVRSLETGWRECNVPFKSSVENSREVKGEIIRLWMKVANGLWVIRKRGMGEVPLNVLGVGRRNGILFERTRKGSGGPFFGGGSPCRQVGLTAVAEQSAGKNTVTFS